MMQYASTGVRNTARKGSNTLVHGGHNRHGGTAPANATTKSIHTSSFLRSVLHAPHLPSIPALPPRDPYYKLFSASKNFLQRFFAHLTAPGLRAPAYLAEVQNYSARSLHGTALRGATIQNGLSFPVRNSLRSHALQRQANMFLPRGPGPVPPRCGGVAQVGLGVARNFSTARPIFQQIAQNVPIAGRALYEIEWDLETTKEYQRMRLAGQNGVKKVTKTHSMLKASENVKKHKSSVVAEDKENKVHNTVTIKEDIEHYFPFVETPLVTTYLFVPLAPTPTARLPLPSDPLASPRINWEPALLPPLSFIGSFHASHSTHALRVSTLFTRLDQANVWSRGVHCSAYSQGRVHQRQHLKHEETDNGGEGVCTILKIEFKGWTQSEVRSVIGESGTGWCMLEEVFSTEELAEEEDCSDDSLASSVLGDHSIFSDVSSEQPGESIESTTFDPTESFILPTLDMSSNFSAPTSFTGLGSTEGVLSSIPLEMESDPWVDEYASNFSSPSSSYSDLSDLIIDPPSANGWFGGHESGSHFGFNSHFDRERVIGEEPREQMFY